MLQYPADFIHWSRTLHPVDDFLLPTVATFAAGSGAWTSILDPAIAAAASATDPSAYVMYNASPTPGDWAQTQYVGWGFELNFRTASGLGLCDIWVDGAPWQTNVEPYGTGAVLTVSNTHLPLDVHRVKVVAQAIPQTRAEAGAVAAEFPQMKVIV